MSTCLDHNCIKNFLGPNLIALFVQCVESGLIIGQAITFWSCVDSQARLSQPETDHGPRQQRRTSGRMLVKVAVVYVIIMSLLQTAISSKNAWQAVVLDFGNYSGAVQVHWLTKVQQFVNTLLAAPAQGFLIWRCWMVTGRNSYLLIGLLALIVSSAIMAIVVSASILAANVPLTFSGDNVASNFAINSYDALIGSMLISTLLDVLLAGILFTYLFRSWNVVVSRQFRKTLQLLIIVIWEASLPPCICGIITLILCAKSSHASFWFILFQSALGQLYVISFFVTINGFLSVKNSMDTGITPTTVMITSWAVTGGHPDRPDSDLETVRVSRPAEGRIGISVTVDVSTKAYCLRSPHSPLVVRFLFINLRFRHGRVQTTRDPENPPSLSLAHRLSRRARRQSRRSSRKRHIVAIPVPLPSPNSDICDIGEPSTKGAGNSSFGENGCDDK
ncbi:hypothetical protein M0805_004562 [Coniferiporia weirii]|nr:hypothetical protein M0805_004562 [Coniferiporia weirii]